MSSSPTPSDRHAHVAAQDHSEQPPGPGWPPVMTDEEAKAKLREKVKARRERDAARIRLLREIVALCRLHGLTFGEALAEYEASRV